MLKPKMMDTDELLILILRLRKKGGEGLFKDEGESALCQVPK